MARTPALAVFAIIGLLAAWGGTSLASLGDGRPAGNGSNFAANLNLQSDDCGHDVFIWDSPAPHNLPLSVVTQPGDPGQPDRISIFGPASSPFVDVHGIMEGTSFFAQGTGPVGPNSNASVEMQGTWNGSTLTGKYTMGSGENDLPPCGQPPAHHPAVYTIKPKPGTPTLTSTPTPPEKSYSIIVLKLDDDTLLPLPGWQINLYAGANCQGSPITSQSTDEDGMVDFLGLDPGGYSVREKPQTGWNPVEDECQDVQVAAAGSPAGLPACPIIPDALHPQPGCDTFQSGARVVVEINASGERSSVTLSGPTRIARLNKPADLDADGLDEIETEMVGMELTGGGITVRASSTVDSTGLIEEQQNITPGALDFPADSFFDVFFEIELPGGIILHNDTPFRVECKIEEIPPYLCFYLPPVRTPIILDNAQEEKIATLLHGLHLPVPPKQSLVIFANQQKATPTSTPTRTPTPPDFVTPTPTNPAPNGECDKQGQDVPFAGQVWDQWKCFAPSGLRFDRVDIFVGKSTQDLKLNPEQPPLFICQTTQEQATGVFKAHKKDVNPAPLPDSEIWSGDFEQKCENGVNVYLRSRLPENHAQVLQVAFTNLSGPGPTVPATPVPATPTRTPTATPEKPVGDVNDDGRVNSLDALLILQIVAALIDETDVPNAASGDANLDGDLTSIDAVLVLQVDAGLLDGLPPLLAARPFALGAVW
jgi:hypothetical protein